MNNVNVNIKIENLNGEMVVSSREVAKNFGKRHDHVLRDIRSKIEVNPILGTPKYFMENKIINSQNKQEYTEYFMTRNGFSFLVMGFTGRKADEWKLKYIEAFNQMEEYIKSQQKSLPSNYKEALQQLLMEEEEKEKLQLENHQQRVIIHELQPKAVFADSVSASRTSILVGELAKIIKQNGYDIGQNRLFKWLRENNYLISRSGADFNLPTQKSMNLGLFEITETSITHADGRISVKPTPKVTGKGQIYFINKFSKELVKC